MYKGTLIAVRDIEASKAFYTALFNIRVVNDFGANVQLEGGLFLQTLDSWQGFINESNISAGNDSELYFEVGDIDEFCERLQKYPVEYVHGLMEHRWGQRVIRLYDPDHHIIEAAETLEAVVKRFAARGMNTGEIARRMDVPEELVRQCPEGEIS